LSEDLMSGTDREVDEFLATAEDFLRRRGTLDYVREHLTQDDAAPSFDREIWQTQGELGWTSLALPEPFGGSPYPLSVAGRLLQVCGRHLVPEPILSTIGLAVPVLRAQSGEPTARILRSIGEGDLAVAIAGSTDMSTSGPTARVRLEGCGDEWKVFGSIHALDVPGADLVLVPVTINGGWRWLATDLDGVDAAVTTLIDGRRQSVIEFDGIALSAECVLSPVLEEDELLAPVVITGAALTSAWLLGIAERAFDLTVDYLKVRSQFGALIGSYQALQHRISRLFCELEVARSVVAAALRALDDVTTDAALWASAAKARVGDLALRMTSEAIQLHGGIGMTHEADVGMYFKAARVANLVAGDREFHRMRAGLLLGIEWNGTL
jgi:alkylation response protein AidB-like acyl-CoA dehydrogenase